MKARVPKVMSGHIIADTRRYGMMSKHVADDTQGYNFIAIAFSNALNKVPNYGLMSLNVHHYIVWIVSSRQILQYCDLFRFSTLLIKSR
eukprot:6173233-Pleurochrysis_carterae.AAC.1